MANPLIGVGNLLVNDLLSDVSYVLIQNPVNTSVPFGGVSAGSQTVATWDNSLYVGAHIVIGQQGDSNLEVVEVTAVNAGVSFTATFQYAHAAGILITGPTFPVRQPTDPFFTQLEMLGYASQAINDFLSECPIAISVSTAVTVPPTTQNVALPSDCQKPVRVGVAGYPLRETSQSNLDTNNYLWQLQSASQPFSYFRDKVPLQNLGIYPRANNTVPLELVYEQRGPAFVGLADGFIFPDAFVPIVKARVLEYAFGKNGEFRSPSMAKFWAGRYAMGVKIANVFLGVVNDSNLEMAS